MTLGFVAWILATVLFWIWGAAMLTGETAGGLVHILLGVAIGIVMVGILRYQRRRQHR